MTDNPLKELTRLRRERDTAVGAMLLLAHDGVISSSRCAELLNMGLLDMRTEWMRIEGEWAKEICDDEKGEA